MVRRTPTPAEGRQRGGDSHAVCSCGLLRAREATLPASRWSRKTLGVIAVVAAIGVAAVASSIRDAFDEQEPRKKPARPPSAASSTSAKELALPGTNRVPSGRAPTVDYVIDLDTRVMTPLPRAIIRSVAKAKMGLPRYAASPDGSSLAYVGIGDNGSRQIFTARINGSRIRQMTLGDSDAWSPAWSPDGTKIAYEGFGGDGVRKLFVLDVGTGESTPIAGAGRLPPWAQPQFTPDGSALLYSDPPVLGVVPIDGGKSTVLIGPRQGFEVGNGSLSPDGSLVTMMGNEVDGPGALRFVANVDGTKLQSMPLSGSNPAGTWSPDGHRIACRNYSGNRIFVVDLATNWPTRVAKGSAAIWLDGHTLLVEV